MEKMTFRPLHRGRFRCSNGTIITSGQVKAYRFRLEKEEQVKRNSAPHLAKESRDKKEMPSVRAIRAYNGFVAKCPHCKAKQGIEFGARKSIEVRCNKCGGSYEAEESWW